MTTKEQTELDAWIAINVMGYIPCRGDYWVNAVNDGKFNCDPKEADSWAYEYTGGNTVDKSGKTYCGMATYQWNPTTDPAAAFEVLKRCAEKLGNKRHAVSFAFNQGEWCVCEFPPIGSCFNHVLNESLEIAICEFAKIIFTKL